MKHPAISSFIDLNELSDGRYAVFNRYTKRTFTLGKDEFNVLAHMDGVRGPADLAQYTRYSQVQIEHLIKAFEEVGFLNTAVIKRKINILKLSLSIINPNKLFKSDVFVRVISSILLFGMLPLLIFGVFFNILMGANLDRIFTDILSSVSSPSFIIAFPIILLITFLHEMGHSIIAKRYGVNVPEMGIMLYWFMPAAYVNLTGVVFLKKKKQKIVVYLAGIFTNLFILALILIARPFVTDRFQFVISWFVIETLLSIIFNLMIFLKLDGYLIFKELVDIPELREKSLKYIWDSIKRITSRRQLNNITHLQIQYNTNDFSNLQKGIFTCYGLLSMLFIPVLLLSIGISVLMRLLG